MTDTYATTPQLTARLSTAYTVPADASLVLQKASELIDYATLGRAQLAYDGDDADVIALLADATCDQVEFWLEVGEEHDVLALTGFLQGGRVQVQKMPPRLAPRAKQQLVRAGLFWAGAGAQ